MKTPGVYIVEKNAFPNSIVEVATAVPAFIGYTERADNDGRSLKNKPWRITSLAEYHQHFGGAPVPKFGITQVADPLQADVPHGASPEVGHVLDHEAGRYFLYLGMRQFFQNGGGTCHVVSVGDYGASISAADLTNGIAQLVNEPEPTMVVVPDCVLLGESGEKPGGDECDAVQQAMLRHCGELGSRVAILDIWGGNQPDRANHCIDNFREGLGMNHLSFGAAYYPWLHTTTVQESELDYRNFSDPAKLAELLGADVPEAARTAVDQLTWTDAQWVTKRAEESGSTRQPESAEPTAPSDDDKAWMATRQRLLNQTLVAASPLFRTLLVVMRRKLNLLPPSAAMAGIYTMVDNARGVWKAPANVSLNGVVEPAVELSKEDQEDLNVTPQGKSINAIRSFIGEGVLVWGARTLDGNSLDWRYVNVRRTMIMLEQSCRLAAEAMVFEPNVPATWITLKGMIQNFLTGIWKRGGLAGAVPEDAFSVHVGLGETMTRDDILEGILRVTVLVATVRPAEFIEITFQQKMQRS